jgi:hypothetical protein
MKKKELKIKENEKYYFHYFLGKGDVKDIERNVIYYNYLKELFFDVNSYKWKITSYKSFVRRNNLDYNICSNAIINLVLPSYIVKEKGFNDFQRNIEKYNNKENTKGKIKIKEGLGKSFIRDFDKLRENYFEIFNNKFIDLIDTNFDTGLTKNTMKNYYTNKKFKKELP